MPVWKKLMAGLAVALAGGDRVHAQSTTADLAPQGMYSGLLDPGLQQNGGTSAAKVDGAQRAGGQLVHRLQPPSSDRYVQEAIQPVAMTAGTETGDGSIAAKPSCCDSECCAREGLLDNLSFFAGLDGSKQPQDLGVNAHMGGRLEVNWGFPLLPSYGIGGQVGTAYNFYDNAVHVLDQVQGTNDSFQNFTTIGLFQRLNGLNWGIAYDFLDERYYDRFHLGQWRGQVGYQVRPCDELGVWFAIEDRDDQTVLLGVPLRLEPLSQANFYWRHTWCNRAQTAFWLGMAEGHGRTVFSISAEPPTGNVLTYGAEVYVPLSQCLALYGAANFLTPADTGTVDAYLGIMFIPGGAMDARSRRFAPLLPVANNPFFAVDLR